MAPSLSKHITQKNALIGGAVAGVPLILYLLKKYTHEKKKTGQRYVIYVMFI